MYLEKYLEEIEKVSKERTQEGLKAIIINRLWEKYKNEKEEYGITQNSELYINKTKLDIKEINVESFKNSVNNLKNNTLKEEDIYIILDWVIYNLYSQLKKINIDMNQNSLDGFCELAQLMVIYPLEELGLKVTKNTAFSTFDYDGNHSFGTVTFPINDKEEVFLIDPTYKQFFLMENCTLGKKYLNQKVSPGYYTNKEFASKLLDKGYIKLTEETAKKYGEPFLKSNGILNTNIDYYNKILSSTEEYSYKKEQVDGLDYQLPRTIK